MPNPKPKGVRPKPVKAWAGIVEDRIDMRYGPLLRDGAESQPTAGVFPTRRMARQYYVSVIPVLITPLPRKRAKKK